jgi:hypothetical protein
MTGFMIGFSRSSASMTALPARFDERFCLAAREIGNKSEGSGYQSAAQERNLEMKESVPKEKQCRSANWE